MRPAPEQDTGGLRRQNPHPSLCLNVGFSEKSIFSPPVGLIRSARKPNAPFASPGLGVLSTPLFPRIPLTYALDLASTARPVARRPATP